MRLFGLAILAMLLLPAPGAAQDSARVTGRVVDSQGAPVVAALIAVGDGAPRVMAGADGRYELKVAAPARVTLRAESLGLRTGTSNVLDLMPGAQLVVNFALQSTAIDETGMAIVISDPLPPRGNARDTLLGADQAGAFTLTESLVARSPSLMVRSNSGVLGAGASVYLRGPSSLIYPNAPLVVVDGVRYLSEAGALGTEVGGQSPSRLDDLDPGEIDQVVLLPGPAASAKYGPGGANGVLEITTRRGRSSSGMRIEGSVEAGLRQDPGGYPLVWSRPGTASDGSYLGMCTLSMERSGVCSATQDSVRSQDAVSGEFGSGTHRGARVGLETGGVWGSVRASARLSRTDGVRDAEQWDRRGLGAAVLLRPVAGVTVDASAAHLSGDLALVPGDNSVGGPIIHGLYAPYAPWETPTFRPVNQDQVHDTRRISATWTALHWLRLSARTGLDLSDRQDVFTTPEASGTYRSEHQQRWSRRTSGLGAAALWSTMGVDAVTSLEAERWSEHRYSHYLATSSSGAFSEETSWLSDRAWGVSAEQALESGRFGFTGVLRRDESELDKGEVWSGSLRGRARVFDLNGYPVRLRGAYGWSRRPLPIGTFFLCSLDCPEVEGARVRDAEVGADADVLVGRLSLSVTGYQREGDEPLFVAGGGLDRRISVRNRGLEATALGELRGGARPWTVELMLWVNQNRVTHMDGAPITGLNSTTSQYALLDHPLGSYFGPGIIDIRDLDGDGTIGRACRTGTCEVLVSDSVRFLGSPLPTHGVVVGSRLQLHERLIVSARLEHQGGNRILNYTHLLQCRLIETCRAVVDPTSSWQDQANAQAARIGVVEGYLEDGAFTRLRELSATLSAPTALAEAIGAGALELVVSGRNLVTLTGYSGADPEVSYLGSSSPYLAGDFLTQANPRVWTVRLQARY